MLTVGCFRDFAKESVAEVETCPICLSEMGESEQVVQCRTGCQNFHEQCINICASSYDVTCVVSL